LRKDIGDIAKLPFEVARSGSWTRLGSAAMNRQKRKDEKYTHTKRQAPSLLSTSNISDESLVVCHFWSIATSLFDSLDLARVQSGPSSQSGEIKLRSLRFL